MNTQPTAGARSIQSHNSTSNTSAQSLFARIKAEFSSTPLASKIVAGPSTPRSFDAQVRGDTYSH